MMLRPPPTPDEGREETDLLLADCKPVAPRGAVVKAATWRSLRVRAMEGQGRTPRSLRFARTPAFVAALCSLALIAWGLASWSERPRAGLGQEVSKGATSHLGSPSNSPSVAPPLEVSPREGWRQIDLGSVGQLSLSASASLKLPASAPAPGDTYSVSLESGELCAAIAHRDTEKQGPFVVEASSLRVVVVGTRFCVSAGDTPDSSWVSVEDGRVRVERDGRSATVSAGEVLQGGDPALRPPPTAPHASIAPAPGVSSARKASTCAATDPLPVRRRCLWRLAGGDDLAAQNALYMLGLLARDEERDGLAALSIWQTYRQRFSHGAMTAEIDLAMLKELTAQDRFDEVVTVSDQFLGEFPRNFRAGEVRLKRADILRTRLSRPAEAADAYRGVLSAEPNPGLRAEALYGLGLSQEAMGKMAEASSTWERYRAEYPQGRRVSEIARHTNGHLPDQ